MADEATKTDLHEHAESLGISTEGKSDLDIAREVAAAESETKADTQADTPAERSDREVLGDQQRPSTRGEGAERSRVGKLDADDPAAGTVDDPNVEDPYAGLAAKQKVLDDAAAEATSG